MAPGHSQSCVTVLGRRSSSQDKVIFNAKRPPVFSWRKNARLPVCVKTLTNESIPDASSAQLHARLWESPLVPSPC